MNGCFGARAREVNRAREHVLAGAGLALEEHRGVGRRDALEHAEDRAHGEALADGRAELGLLAREHLDLLRRGAHDDLDLADRKTVPGGASASRILAPSMRVPLVEPRSLTEHAVGAPIELAVVARDRVVGEDEVVVGRLADAHTLFDGE